MKRQASAIVQRKEGWCGVTFELRQKEISGLTLIADKSLSELEGRFGESGYGIGLENGSAYLFDLSFPFSDKRKIRLVIANELEERMPVAVDDMIVDFVETGKGKVLAGAMVKSSSGEPASKRHVRITTVQSLAVLHALRWFDRVRYKDFVFLHMNGNAVVVMAFKDDSLYYLRQFVHSPLSTSLHDAFLQMKAAGGLAPRSYIMVADGEEGMSVKSYLESTFGIDIEIPRLRETLGSGDGPGWLWGAVGTALLSLNPKGQLDLTGQKRRHLFLSTKASLYLTAGLATLGFLTWGLLYADYYFKQQAYQFLVTEPGRVYRLSFPKSPPVKDPTRLFRDKIRALEQAPDAVNSAVSPLAVLDEISKRIAPDIDLKVSEFNSDEKEFTISGTTVSFAAVEKIRDSIEHITGVSQVEMQNLDLAANKQVKFKLRGKIMKVFDRLAAVPEKIYLFLFLGIFLVTAISSYFTWQDMVILEGRISARQRDLAEVLQLRDTYEAKKHETDRHVLRKPDNPAISLALVEGMVTKSFVGGILTALQPAIGKEEKGNKQMAVEVKVSGAALGEIVAFVKATESAGLRIEKLHLSLPASNPAALDMQATIAERRIHG